MPIGESRKEFMNFEKPSKIEQTSGNKERLLALEKQEKFVFHGSPYAIDDLEPRQGYNYNEKTGQKEKDGNPAVFSTPFIDVAIFRALINTEGVTGKSMSKFGIEGERLHFSATKNLVDQAKKKIGKIYVLDKLKFKDFEGTECRSEEKVIPIEVFEVTAEDLPENIKIKE